MGEYNEIMKCASAFSKRDRWDPLFLDTIKRLPGVSTFSGLVMEFYPLVNVRPFVLELRHTLGRNGGPCLPPDNVN